MKKIFGYFVVAISISTLLTFVNGKEKWEDHIEEVHQIGASTDGEIYSVMHKYGFGHMDVMDDPSAIDFIIAGFKPIK